MHDSPQVSPDSPASVSGEQATPSFSVLRALLYCGLAAAAAMVAYTMVQYRADQASLEEANKRLVGHHGLIDRGEVKLAADYLDDDGNLLADAPKSAEASIDPETLVLAYYQGDDDDEQTVDWEKLREHLAAATGKGVATQPYLNSAEEVAAVKNGTIHIVALHAADTPYLVNHAGFVPIAVLGTEASASGNHLALAVKPDSKIEKLADLQGKTLACTRPDSISGYRAAVAVLSREAGMRPGVDYQILFSFGQRLSIGGLLDGKYEVAALSADKLQSMRENGELAETDYRLIYESQVIPRRTIGHIHRLKPEMAAKVVEALMSFENAGAETEGDTEAATQFVAIDYKGDFGFPRYIDDCFDPRFGQVATTNPLP